MRLFFVFMLLCTASLFAQDLAPDYKQSATLGKRYDLMLSRQLAQYFQPGSFVVQSKVYLEEVLTPVEFENGARLFDGQEALPGLPVVAKDSAQRYQDSLLVSRYRKDFELKFVEINIIVDTRYSASDLAFIQDFVKMTANLDESRGDRVKLNRRPFPKSEADAALNPETPLKLKDSLPGLPPKLDSLYRVPSTEEKEQISWILWAILGTLGTLLFALLLWFLFSRRKSELSSADQMRMNQMASELQELKNRGSEGPKVIPPLPADQRSPAWTEGRNFLINQMVGNPRTVAQIFEAWIEGQDQNGLNKSVLALESLDYRLIRMFKNNMNADLLSKLELALQTFPGAEEQDKTAALQEFRKDFLTLSGAGNDRQSDLFFFLEQMTVHQLKHLIADEAAGIKAVALAQVKPALAAQILQELEEPHRAQVLVNMGQIQNITVRAYKDIADRLSAKALSLTDMRYVASDGVESVLNLVLGLPVNSQAQYIQSIAEQDLELAQRIRNSYVPFDELLSVDAKQLAAILDSVDREILALSLMRAEPEFVTQVLALFPERSRMMLLSTMESQVDKTLDEVEAARRLLLGFARKEFARQGGVRR